MHAVNVVISAGWVVFWLGWLFAAFTAKAGTGRGTRFFAIRVALAVVVVLALRLLGSGHLHLLAPDPGPVLAVVGLVLWAAGLALAVWARVFIGRNWGMPMTRKKQPELVTAGPYRIVRNPIYTGLILAMAGTALATTWYALIPFAVVAGFFVYSAVREQRYLAGEFPDTYPAYQRSTKMLVPFVF